MVEVAMPKLGLTMQEGKVVTWYKKEGERVERGEPLLAVETEKITNDIESPASGILKEIVAPVDTVVPVTETVGLIEEGVGGERKEEDTIQVSKQTIEEAKDESKPSREGTKAAGAQIAKERVSPLALKLAEDHNIDLSGIEGTGLGGMITKNDVLKAVESKAQAPSVQVPSEQAPSEQVLSEQSLFEMGVSETVEMSLTRRKTAERLSQMHKETPHVTITTPIDMTNSVSLRDKLKDTVEKKTGKKLTFTHLFARAVSMALKEFGDINSRLADDKIIKLREINLGIAVDVEEGLLVPVVKGAGEMNLEELAEKISELMDRAKNRELALDDITGGTFTISNLGILDIDVFTPLINPPECAILGIGKMFKRAWVVDDRIEPRQIATFSLTFDHRIIDGAYAARFLQKVKEILERPEHISGEEL
jgi:pyruvate dehydrogenase E2 component (dihydrolipoamide acetyltransferase)